MFAGAAASTQRRLNRTLALLSMAAFLAGCGQDQIQVYQVPKEKSRWLVPAGWEEQPAEKMRVASFHIHGENNREAEVAVIPFPGMGGTDLQFVNLWRQQLKLSPLTQSELAGQTETVAVGDVTGKLFDLTAAEASGAAGQPERIVVAVVPHEGTTWFFKMAGSSPLVAREKPAFTQFLKSFSLPEAAKLAQAMAASQRSQMSGAEPAPEPVERPKLPEWEVPPSWKSQPPPNEMVLASFALADAEGGKADLTVTVLGGASGGLLANVNRWRGQIGLAPVAEAELTSLARPLDEKAGSATLVDMTGERNGQKARIIGAVVPKGNRTWYYKILGSERVAEQEKAAFLKFIQTVRYPDA